MSQIEEKHVHPDNGCCCGHDHEHHDGCCGHDHEHHHHDHDGDEPTRCISCGAPLGEGAGHSRAMGRASFAFVGGFLIVNSFLLEWIFPDFHFAASLSAALGAVCLAFPIVLTAIKDLVEGRVYMNELVALAILAAFTSGNFQTAGIIAFFLLITIIIETHTASGAQRSIEELIRLTPHTAHRILPDGTYAEADVSELKLGDLINVRPGENFPVDGVIVRGESAVNQASITGESMPVDKDVDDDVYAGTMNLSGSIDVKVTRLGGDTTLGKVKEMILSAERNKTPVVRIIDRYAGYYTPTILMLATITWWLTDGNMNRVIALLVIACPCAVVLATPTTIVAAVAAAARLGILIKNVSHLELASKIRTVVFDKTGTLTEGQLSVARLSPAEGVEPAELLQTAFTLERNSNHPTAMAIQRLAGEVGISALPMENFKETAGKGVAARIAGRDILVGRPAWIESAGIRLEGYNTSESEGMSVVFVAAGGRVIGWIGFKDSIRPEAVSAIRNLKDLGIVRCAMVTGDRASVATAIAAQLNIDDVKSDCLPQGKVEYVEEVKKTSVVAVVGDGVNDAPALAAGDLGIAMGAIGSDIAISSASIALMTNDLRRIPLLVTLSRKTGSIMNQNLAFGLLFVICGIVLSVFGRMDPVLAAVLHTVSTLIVIFNSARLVRTGEEYTGTDGVPVLEGRSDS
ncbi:MAG: cadmium-translocating P-type ATPase [Lentisphaeria bacterium]|nr:cadmium-translocating P-type ATPase [Lentisphaeria bacterium]